MKSKFDVAQQAFFREILFYSEESQTLSYRREEMDSISLSITKGRSICPFSVRDTRKINVLFVLCLCTQGVPGLSFPVFILRCESIRGV